MTDHFVLCQEQKYTSINDKTIYLIILSHFIVTEKQYYCYTGKIYVALKAELYLKYIGSIETLYCICDTIGQI